ncbi:TMEM165/GDT1 family protein [Sporomusa sp.]|uniref:TMEM165/GDT1 family protein n=1 Tax=Sporomusa sp. TaxID=2078658 RepID=UPI002BF26EE0|nr:TMEM165/GDT1 family protein [Sporomusa sp.]HWR42234.1 TMEM165/GDT1 family protein [Sporomusa sp.]
MTAFLTSLVFVILAEMGDKTQLLAMAFATRYCWRTVMWGVFAATILNHLFAVVVGSYLTHFIPMNYIQVAAAVSFIIFGLWTIRGDELNGEDRACKRSPFWTVAIAFFIAEMGDKTQLATVALAAQFNTIIPVWLGTTTGMMVADGIGIIIGIVLGKRIPERAVKWFAAIIFILFGLFGLYEYLPSQYLTPATITGSLVTLIILIYLVARMGGDESKLPKKLSPEE